MSHSRRNTWNRRKTIQCILAGLGLGGFLWLILPFVCKGILNIGNITGMLLCLALFLYGWKLPRVNGWLRRFRSGRAGKLVLGLAGAVALLCVVLVTAETVCMVSANRKEAPEDATMVVLGCKVQGEAPSLMLQERLDAAFAYLSEHEETVCILSGGQGSDEDISEAECMYRYLTERGIAPERLYVEDRSESTRENLRFSGEIIEEEGLSRNILIVTNEFHTYRAGRIAEELGMEYGSAPGKTAWWLLPTYYIRELYAILQQWIL